MRRRVFVAALSVALGGCATAFQRPADPEAYGPPPTDIESQVRAHFDRVLKDPESARYRLGVPRRGYLNNGLIYGGQVVAQGWVVDVSVNAKNSYGGYTGFEPYLGVFVGGRLAYVLTGAEYPLLNLVD